MSNVKKLMMTAAGGEGLSVEEVFSTYTYKGSSSSKTINNGIDLSNEGGLVWIKKRTDIGHHWLLDTTLGASKTRSSSQASSDDSVGYWNFSFNSNGFGMNTTDSNINTVTEEYCSWTFRKAPKFFDIVTYTGTGSPQSIAHNLGSVPGAIFIMSHDNSTGWAVYHRGNTSAPETERLILEQTYATSDDANYWNDTAPTSTHFTVGSTIRTNSNGYGYVAYIFAHNDGDGNFGPTGDQDIIKCGGFTTTSTGTGSVNLGFEPQYMLIKSSSAVNNWFLADNIRRWGFPISSTDATFRYLLANSNGAEGDTYLVDPTSTGFNYRGAGGSRDYVYIAIRRGPMKTPENATDVFDVQRGSSPFTADFPTDLGIQRNVTSSGQWYTHNRLSGDNKYLILNSSNQLGSYSSGYDQSFDNMTEWGGTNWGSQSAGYSFRRAPGFFDMTIIPGNGSTTNTTYYHNLGVVPELIIGKQLSTGNSWWVYHKDVYPSDHRLNNDSYDLIANVWNDSSSYVPTETTFTTRGQGFNEAASNTYLILLWATLAGISKVGTYTGNGSSSGDSQNIDCGFSSGARFVLIKRINHIYSDWYVADTGRGIVSGNDSYLYMNRDNVEYTGVDWIDPYSGGFAAVYTNDYGINVSGDTYMYLAIA